MLQLARIHILLLSLSFLPGNLSAFHEEEQHDMKLLYIINDTTRYTIDDIRRLEKENRLHEGNQNFNLGYKAAHVWILLKIDTCLAQCILTINNAHLDHIDIYFDNGEKTEGPRRTGDNRDFYTRDIYNNFFNFKIPSHTNRIFLKVHSEGPMAVPIQILNYNEYFSYWRKYSVFHWIYLGFISFFMVSNILLYLWLRESIYIYYCLFLLSLGIITGVDFGYTFQYLWPHHPAINQYNSAFYFLSALSLLFTEKILNLRKDAPLLLRVFQFLYAFVFLSFLSSFFISYRSSIEIINLIYTYAPVISLITAVYIYLRHKNQSSRFLLIGLCALFLCSLVYILAVSGRLEYNTITENMLQIGSGIQILFFNLATLSKINVLKKEKEELLFEQNRVLEEKVFQRTLELSHKNEKIVSQHKLIEKANRLLKHQHDNLEREVEQRTDELRQLNAELIDKNNRLEQFAFVTAHNVRGPVATLLGLCQIYNRKDLCDPHNMLVIDKTQNITQKLDNIIRDLSILVDLEKNVDTLSEEIDLKEVTEEIMVLLDREIQESGASIEYDFSKAPSVTGVPAYLKNIFYNLISNSIKFRKYDTAPEIHISSGWKEGYYTLLFKDNGSGIEMDKYGSNLGNPYKRFHPDVEGKGLGLFITKKQIEAMKGDMKIHSERNKGTSIEIVIREKKQTTTMPVVP